MITDRPGAEYAIAGAGIGVAAIAVQTMMFDISKFAAAQIVCIAPAVVFFLVFASLVFFTEQDTPTPKPAKRLFLVLGGMLVSGLVATFAFVVNLAIG